MWLLAGTAVRGPGVPYYFAPRSRAPVEPPHLLHHESWHADPEKGDYPIRLTNWPAVSLTVVVGRPAIRSTEAEWADHSPAVVGKVQRALVAALGGRVTGDSPVALRVTFVTHTARFDNGTWSGSTRLSAQALRGGQPAGVEAMAIKRVDRFNWAGTITARNVLRESLESAFAALLSQLCAAPPNSFTISRTEVWFEERVPHRLAGAAPKSQE